MASTISEEDEIIHPMPIPKGVISEKITNISFIVDSFVIFLTKLIPYERQIRENDKFNMNRENFFFFIKLRLPT
jgi:hypothetical protein